MSDEPKDDVIIYTPKEFARIIEIYLDGAGYPYCNVEADEDSETFNFAVTGGLPTKSWGYEDFLKDYECDEHEPWNHDYQERILREMYGTLGKVECGKGEIRVHFMRPYVYSGAYA